MSFGLLDLYADDPAVFVVVQTRAGRQREAVRVRAPEAAAAAGAAGDFGDAGGHELARSHAATNARERSHDLDRRPLAGCEHGAGHCLANDVAGDRTVGCDPDRRVRCELDLRTLVARVLSSAVRR